MEAENNDYSLIGVGAPKGFELTSLKQENEKNLKLDRVGAAMIIAGFTTLFIPSVSLLSEKARNTVSQQDAFLGTAGWIVFGVGIGATLAGTFILSRREKKLGQSATEKL